MNPAHNLVKSVAEKVTLPDVYHRIRNLMAVPDAEIDDFVEVINTDSALAARIVRIADSTFLAMCVKRLR